MTDAREKVEAQARRFGIPVDGTELNPQEAFESTLKTITERVLAEVPNRKDGRGRPSRKKEHLRMRYQLEDVRVEQSKESYHCQRKQSISHLLADSVNGDLRPRRMLSSGQTVEDAVDSQYRKDCSRLAREEQAQQASMTAEWRSFLAPLDDHTHDLVLKLCHLLHAVLDGAAVEEEKTLWHHWLALSQKTLPNSVFSDLIYIFTAVGMRETLAGFHLQQRAIAEHTEGRQPYQRPKSHNI